MIDGDTSAALPNRRWLLRQAGAGFGTLALSAILADEAREASPANPLAPRVPHFPPRAKRVIFLFMPGGPSQVDTFDPKPRLTRGPWQAIAEALPGPDQEFTRLAVEVPQARRVGPRGERALSAHRGVRDHLCVIRSMVADDPNHPGGCLLMNTGERVATRPSLGSWVSYGLGTENQNLPGFLAIGPGPLIEGGRQYGAASCRRRSRERSSPTWKDRSAT